MSEEVDCQQRLDRVMFLAETVFGSKKKAQSWMSKPQKKLDGLTPKDMIFKTKDSAELVEKLLKKIEEGYF